MAEVNAYNEAAKSGRYEKPAGLLGKYDNVRRFWEDAQMGLYLRPYLEQLVSQRKQQGEKLRVMDIGCGSGDGFELLMAIDRSRSPAEEQNTRLVDPGSVFYKGIDINQVLLEQARGIYGDNGNMVFAERDHGWVCTGFKSDETGRTYPIKRLEPEAFMYINDLFNSGDLALNGNHYVEDVTIVHEISGDCTADRDGESCEVSNQHFDGKPVSDYDLSADFQMAIDDVIYNEFIQRDEEYL